MLQFRNDHCSGMLSVKIGRDWRRLGCCCKCRLVNLQQTFLGRKGQQQQGLLNKLTLGQASLNMEKGVVVIETHRCNQLKKIYLYCLHCVY